MTKTDHPAATITAEQLAELKAAFEKATKGEWDTIEHSWEQTGVFAKGRNSRVAVCEIDGDVTEDTEDTFVAIKNYDAAFIALAHNLMPSLISAADEAAKEIERLSGELTKARHVMRETLWMARRYADGRNTYAPGMLNRAVNVAIELGAIENKPNGEPVFAGDLLGAHASGISEEEYQRVVAARGNVERLIVEERKAERDAAFAAGRKEGLEDAAQIAFCYEGHMAQDIFEDIRSLIEKEPANV